MHVSWWLWVFVIAMLHMLCSADFSHELVQGKCLDDNVSSELYELRSFVLSQSLLHGEW